MLALAINMVCYTDRVAIAAAGPEIKRAFGLDPAQMGLVFSVFSLSYALGQMPWGMLADRFGARGIVACAVLGWSLFTGLTATAWNLGSLLLIRFLFGALEAALSPSIAAVFGRWIPLQERATAFGAYLGGGRLGGAIAPPGAGLLLAWYGWRAPFITFGLLGLAGAVAWFVWYRNAPSEHRSVSGQELEIIRKGTRGTAQSTTDWSKLLASHRLWSLVAVAFGSTFMWQFYATWFPTYLREYRGMPLTQASYYAGLPFLAGIGSNWLGGLLTDAIGRRKDPRFARTVIGVCSLAGGAALMLLGIWCSGSVPAALLMGLAAGALDLYLSAAWASAVDIGGPSGGAVSGLMNAASNGAGFASPALMGWVLKHANDWNAVLLLAAGSTCLAALIWPSVNPRDEGQS
jgi:ACS family glucarate transporter-like MFS transporter